MTAITTQQLVDGASLLFTDAMRAAQLGCLAHARAFREDKWPTPQDVVAFAKMYGVRAAELGASFGLLSSRAAGGRTVWHDLMRGPVPPPGIPWTREQKIGLGWLTAALETPQPEATCH